MLEDCKNLIFYFHLVSLISVTLLPLLSSPTVCFSSHCGCQLLCIGLKQYREATFHIEIRVLLARRVSLLIFCIFLCRNYGRVFLCFKFFSIHTLAFGTFVSISLKYIFSFGEGNVQACSIKAFLKRNMRVLTDFIVVLILMH